jgi:hypothetical protein
LLCDISCVVCCLWVPFDFDLFFHLSKIS